MQVGIVGLPNVGKSTLFNALTCSYNAEAQNFPFCTIEPNTGIVNVADDRLEKLRAAVGGQKIIPATVEFVDIAGLVEGASKGEGLGNKFLSHIRSVDAVLQVVRAFEDSDVHHVSGSIDPARDRDIINMELILADLETLHKRMADNEKKVRSNDKEAKKNAEVYETVKSHLEQNKIASTLELSKDEKKAIADLHLLTDKPFIYAVNVAEDDLSKSQDELRALLGIADEGIPVLPVSAKMEMEMIDLNDEEKKEFLEMAGLDTNPMDEIIKTCYDLLGLQYYFTAGVQEVRAWTIKKGWTAPQAAGVIHTDFEKKFIKADTVNWADLVEAGGWSEAREHGKVRMEGKEYIVQDGDVMLFKFGG
ncbi:redox-regulated ATPase YchF [Candidatus Gracilibacteria bacterium]|nr:MAG: redox-regulated ATPase YchF [Candidatus Gracilibacteria bacterium]